MVVVSLVMLGHGARASMTREREGEEGLAASTRGWSRRSREREKGRRWCFSWVISYFDFLVEGERGMDLLDGDGDWVGFACDCVMRQGRVVIGIGCMEERNEGGEQ